MARFESEMDKREFLRLCGLTVVGSAALPFLPRPARARASAASEVILSARMRGPHPAVLSVLTHPDADNLIFAANFGGRVQDVLHSFTIQDPESRVWRELERSGETTLTYSHGSKDVAFKAGSQPHLAVRRSRSPDPMENVEKRERGVLDLVEPQLDGGLDAQPAWDVATQTHAAAARLLRDRGHDVRVDDVVQLDLYVLVRIVKLDPVERLFDRAGDGGGRTRPGAGTLDEPGQDEPRRGDRPRVGAVALRDGGVRGRELTG